MPCLGITSEVRVLDRTATGLSPSVKRPRCLGRRWPRIQGTGTANDNQSHFIEQPEKKFLRSPCGFGSRSTPGVGDVSIRWPNEFHLDDHTIILTRCVGLRLPIPRHQSIARIRLQRRKRTRVARIPNEERSACVNLICSPGSWEW